MEDAAGEVSFGVELQLEESGEESTYAVTVSADSDWLDADDRVYPVRIDPTAIQVGKSAIHVACAEQGLKTVAVEKQNRGNYNSATIGGTNSELHKFWGMEYDTVEWMSDAMLSCSFQGDMELYQHFLEKNGEAVNWYLSLIHI